ncbi:MAG: exonuclease domain-containing protein [Thermomicrobiales bacterium]
MDDFAADSGSMVDDVVIAETPAPFASLVERAEAFVAGRGGCTSEDLLISHVFGSSGTPALWRPLLRNVLSTHESLTLRADGSWFLADQQISGDSPLDEFVVLDVETTGLQASRQRIIEIAIVRMSHGVVANQWESFCQPGRKVPAYITKLTGIDDERLDDAPAFGEIAETALELLEGAVIVGHNVAFDLGFLNEELKRVGREPVVNEHLCTLTLATRLMPGLRKPNLNAVAQRLAIPGHSRNRHRAGSDAKVTGLVACALLRQATDAGFHTLDELKAISRPATRRPKDKMPRASAIADRSMLADVPKAPGVYLFRDATDRVVYVGKAKNLRDRVGSYFSQPLGYTRKMDGLIESLKRVQTHVVGSEIEALLLESQLIRRYQPRYNTALRSHEQYPFIRVDVANPWPRVSLSKARKDDGARYFGPFRSAATARKSVELINRVVPLRTCTRSFKDARSYGSPCIQLDIGQCLGPCVGRANRDEYMALVRRVVDYIDGQDDALHEVLWSGLEQAAAALDFERAGRLRRDLNASLSLTAVQRRMRESADAHWGLLVTRSPETGCREVMLLVQGRVWAQFRARDREGAEPLAARLAVSWARYGERGLRPLDHDSVDDLHILSGWLARHEGFPALLPLDDRSAPDWATLARQALALQPDDLDADLWRKTRDAAAVEWDDALLGTGEQTLDAIVD